MDHRAPDDAVGNLVVLKTFSKEANESAVRIAKDLLQLALDGRIQAIGACYILDHGGTNIAFSKCESQSALIGASALLTDAMVRRRNG